MLNKYSTQFDLMYEQVLDGKDVQEVVQGAIPFFEQENIGILGISYYLEKYISKNQNK